MELSVMLHLYTLCLVADWNSYSWNQRKTKNSTLPIIHTFKKNKRTYSRYERRHLETDDVDNWSRKVEWEIRRNPLYDE